MRRAECWATRLQVENHFSTKGVHSDVLGLGGKLGGFDLSGETAWCEWGNTGHGGQPSCPTQTMSASLSKKGDSRLLQDCPTEDVMSIQWGNGFKIAVRDFYFKLTKLSWFLLLGWGLHGEMDCFHFLRSIENKGFSFYKPLSDLMSWVISEPSTPMKSDMTTHQ